MQAFRQSKSDYLLCVPLLIIANNAVAIDNENTLSEYYHTGAYGLLNNPTRWSCCKEEKREAKGCEKMIICSVTLPRGSMPDTMVFSEEELSDNEEMDPVIELSHESAPDPSLVDSEQRYDVLDNVMYMHCRYTLQNAMLLMFGL